MPQEVLADPDALDLCQWHDRPERLEQANEEEVGVTRGEDTVEEREVVIPGLNDFRLKERKRHFVASTVYDAIYGLTGSIRKDHAITI